MELANWQLTLAEWGPDQFALVAISPFGLRCTKYSQSYFYLQHLAGINNRVMGWLTPDFLLKSFIVITSEHVLQFDESLGRALVNHSSPLSNSIFVVQWNNWSVKKFMFVCDTVYLNYLKFLVNCHEFTQIPVNSHKFQKFPGD